MTKITLGIIGGGQLGSMLATAAKKLKIDPYKSETSAKLLRGLLKQPTTKQIKKIKIVVHPISTTIGLHFFHFGIF